MKDAVLASVSHDLRTPLTTIKALAHELAAAGDERASIIEDEADRLNKFVADLLDLSRLSAGVSLSPEPNEAEDLIGAAMQRIGSPVGSGRVNVRVGGNEMLLFGLFDFGQTLRALVNLLENALKYSPADSVVDLAVDRRGDWLEFTVSDRGPGVPDEACERIFEPFYRPESSAPDIGGAGLGLSIARAIARGEQGDITYEPRPGGGSVFVLRVPWVEATALGEP
jgi:two-component system sensor histidine kinase KdpD